MAGGIAVLDACVLHVAPLRDFLIRLSGRGLFWARWTDEIHNEWIRSVRKRRPDIPIAALQRTRTLMNAAIPESLVTGYDGLIDRVTLPDPKDRHVLAAAIHCQAEVIVTQNLKDFPKKVLSKFGIVAMHPDEFICELIADDPIAVHEVVREQQLSLKHPPKTEGE